MNVVLFSISNNFMYIYNYYYLLSLFFAKNSEFLLHVSSKIQCRNVTFYFILKKVIFILFLIKQY